MVDWHALTNEVDHRPFPMPERSWAMTMSWEKLLFAHYRVDATRLRALVPGGLELHLHDGEAWLGIVPFYMRRVGPHRLNWLPWLSQFPELNIRTYVVRDGVPGVFFFSLDASNWAAVIGARVAFNLPYFWASIRWTQDDSRIHYRSRRRLGPSAQLDARYAPTSEPSRAAPGTLEHFLVERYCLYAADRRGTIYRGHVHHGPWPLQAAEADFDPHPLLAWLGLDVTDDRPVLHYVERIDVIAWLNERA